MFKLLIKDSSYYFIGSVIFQLSGLASVIIVMRALEVQQFGLYSYAIAFVTFFGFVADGGLSQYIIKKIAQNPDATTEIYRDAQGAQIVISAVTALALLVFGWAFNPPEEFVTVVVLGSGVVLNGYVTPVYSTLIARGEKRLIVVKDLFSSAGRLFYVLIASQFFPSVLAFAATNIVVACVAILYCLYLRKASDHKFPFHYHLSLQRTGTMLREGLPFAMLMIANILYNRIDVVMLKRLSDEFQVGAYTGATQFIYPFMFVSSVLVTAIFPHLSRNVDSGNAFRVLRKSSFVIMASAGFLLSTFLFFTSEYFFKLFFGAKYDASIPIYKILIWYLFIVFSYGTFSNILVAKGRTVMMFKITMLMLVLNVVLNYFFIEKFGAVGAAIVTLTCEILLCVVTMVLAFKLK
jgi:O-antigen/teichoic acid export membrane protein